MSEVVPVVLATYDQVFNTPSLTVTKRQFFSSTFMCEQKVAALSPLFLRCLFIPCLLCVGKERRVELVKMETALSITIEIVC